MQARYTSIMKRFSRNLIATVLKLSLVALATVAALVLPLSDPNHLKRELAQNQVYESVITELIEENALTYTGEGQQIDAATFRTAATKAFTPELLQSLTDEFLDGTYRWLQGRTAQPDFSLDISSARQAFAQSLAEQAVNRLNGLPACNFAQLQQLQISQIDPFSISCRPPGINLEAEVTRLTDQIANGSEFLPNRSLTVADLPKDASGRTVFEQLHYLPQAYQLLRPTLLILLLLTLLAAGLLIYLHDSRRAGLRQAATTILGTGVFLAISAIVYLLVFRQANTLSSNMAGIQPIVLGVAHALFDRFNQILLIFSAVYATLGVGLLLLTRQRKTTPKQ